MQELLNQLSDSFEDMRKGEQATSDIAVVDERAVVKGQLDSAGRAS